MIKKLKYEATKGEEGGRGEKTEGIPQPKRARGTHEGCSRHGVGVSARVEGGDTRKGAQAARWARGTGYVQGHGARGTRGHGAWSMEDGGHGERERGGEETEK